MEPVTRFDNFPSMSQPPGFKDYEEHNYETKDYHHGGREQLGTKYREN